MCPSQQQPSGLPESAHKHTGTPPWGTHTHTHLAAADAAIVKKGDFKPNN